MPVVLLDRLPLPSLQAYTALSVLLLSCSIYYSIQVTLDPGWRERGDELPDVTTGVEEYKNENITATHGFWLVDAMYFMLQEPMCVWTLINMAYCCLILVGKVIQKIVFGELRVSEQQHIKDKFWNFVFYKFIFIFGVINVQFMDEVVLWCSWFSVLGFLHMLAQLSKDRFEYLSFSPTTPKWTHIRLLALLLGILTMSFGLLCTSGVVGFHAGLNTFAFMAAECVLLCVRTIYVIIRYGIYLWDINHAGVWETRGTYVYYTELLFELTALGVDFFHHLHMFLWGNIFLSMACLVICMQLRYLFHEIQRRFRKHKNYLKVVRYMENNYPMATTEELENNLDDCAVCWDKMESARKLPCGHLFHNSCLRSWLEQDTSCPTCRTALNVQTELEEPRNPLHEPSNPLGEPNTRPTTNHFFHFDASRYVSWLPSFSVEVTHTQLLGRQREAVQTSQLDSMAREVQTMFPNMPLTLIQEDLRATRSIEITIENILDERLVVPPFQRPALRTDPSITTQPMLQPMLEPIADDRLQPVEPIVDLVSTASTSLDKYTLSDPVHSLGGRFSKSPREREVMLALRKDELLQQARRRYLHRQSAGDST